MKTFLFAILVTILTLFSIINLPNILPKKEFKQMSDQELREYALSRNMLPVPTTYKELLKVVNNPNNPLTKEKIELGKDLYFDPILSKNNDIACATCHILNQGGDDNKPTAIGTNGLKNPFHLNSPTVLNSALQKFQFWNGSAKDVEEQAQGPIQAPFEMALTKKEAIDKLSRTPYKKRFEKIFKDGLTFKNIAKAIGAYERTLLTYSPYDKFLNGDNSAISAKAKRGMQLFLTRGCKGCHTGMSVGGQSIQKFPLRAYLSDYLGLSIDSKIKLKNSPYPFEDLGRFRGRNQMQYFKVPILRNIEKTSPYFHNGAVKDLKEAIRIMSKYQLGKEFTKKEIEEVEAFLKTLTGNLVNYDIK